MVMGRLVIGETICRPKFARMCAWMALRSYKWPSPASVTRRICCPLSGQRNLSAFALIILAVSLIVVRMPLKTSRTSATSLG